MIRDELQMEEARRRLKHCISWIFKLQKRIQKRGKGKLREENRTEQKGREGKSSGYDKIGDEGREETGR
jgi:hypothetical protein